MDFIGKALGVSALIGMVGGLLNYISKQYHKYRKNRREGKNDQIFGQLDSLVMQWFVRRHTMWGLLAVTAMVLHAILQIVQFGPVWSGLLTAVFLAAQGILGRRLQQGRDPQILKLHRGIAILLVLFLAVHLVHTEYFL